MQDRYAESVDYSVTVRRPDNDLAYVCNTERTKVGYRSVFWRRGMRRGMVRVL